MHKINTSNFLLTLLTASIFLAACTPPASDESAPITPNASSLVDSLPATQPVINIPLTIYILDDPSGKQSSSRTAEQLNEIYEEVNTIWSQANINIEVQAIQRVEVPLKYLNAIENQQFTAFFAGIGQDFDLPNLALLNAFYASSIGGPNGITPSGSKVFFVTDFPSVHHERVSAHEIGHILGLHHALNDPEHLMYSGTNGTDLNSAEIATARYIAQGLLDGVR